MTNSQDVIRRIYDLETNTIGIRSGATLHAVVNTGAAGVGESLVTVLNPVSISGSVTIDSGTVSVDSNTAWSDPNTYIGLATVDIGSAPTLTVDATGQGDIPVTLDGEVVDASGATIFAVVNTSAGGGNVTLDAGSLTGIVGNVTIDSGTVTLGANSGVDIGDVDVTSNTAWADPNTYIGLATVDIGSAPTLTVDATGQGDVPVTLDSEVVAASQSGTWNVGTVTAVTDVTNPIALKGNVTIVDGGGSITVDNGGTFAVQSTLQTGSNTIGKLAANSGVDIGDVDVTSNTAWADPNAYVGLATVDVGKSERYSYAYTSGPTTNWIVKGSAGFVHAVHVGAAVASSIIELSDHASDGDGNVVLYQASDTIGPAVYPLNMTMGTGITLDLTNQTHVTVVYK